MLFDAVAEQTVGLAFRVVCLGTMAHPQVDPNHQVADRPTVALERDGAAGTPAGREASTPFVLGRQGGRPLYVKAIHMACAYEGPARYNDLLDARYDRQGRDPSSIVVTCNGFALGDHFIN